MSMDMTQQPGTNAPVWHVTRVEDTYGPTSVGGNNRIKRVYFQILGGPETYVDVPVAQFNAAAVAAAIEAHVSDTIDVLQLKGQTF